MHHPGDAEIKHLGRDYLQFRCPWIVRSDYDIAGFDVSVQYPLTVGIVDRFRQGGGDSQCALLGCGAVSPGDLTIIGGTTVPVMAVCDEPTLDAEGRLWAGHHCVPDTWVLAEILVSTHCASLWA